MAMVSASWIANAPAPYLLAAIPDLMWLESSDDVSTYVNALDRGMPIGPLGSYTWFVDQDITDLSTAEKRAALYEQGFSTGNGPYVDMRINTVGPGGLIESDEASFTADITVAGQQSMALRTLSIIGPNNVVFRELEIQESPAHYTIALPHQNWYAALVKGTLNPPFSQHKSWAITAPIWIRRSD